MSVASYSQANAVHYRSMDYAHYPVKDQPPSYDAATGWQVVEHKSAGDTPPFKPLRNGVSEAALFAGRGNEDRNVKWLPRDDERKSAGDAPRAGAPGNAVGSQKVAPAPEVAANLPSAAALKRQIAQFVEKNLGKDAKKAAQIASRIPTNDPIRLSNILENLKLIKGNNGQSYKSLQEMLSWSSSCCSASSSMVKTNADQRLTLRGLMLFMLSDLEPSFYDKNPNSYATIALGVVLVGDSSIKSLDIEELNAKLADAKHRLQFTPDYERPYIETLPVVISAIRPMV